MDILSRIMAIASLFFVLVVGVQVYPMDPAQKIEYTQYIGADKSPFSKHWSPPIPNGFILVAHTAGNQCIGGAAYSVPEPKSPGDEKKGWIWMLYVEPEFRRKKIAHTIIERSVEHMRELGATAVRLDATEIEDVGLSTLVELYKKNKFELMNPDMCEFMVPMIRRFE